MRITSLETLRPALQPNLVFVLLHADDGTVGLGEAFFGAQAVEAYLHETAAKILFDLDDVTPVGAALALRPYNGFASGGVEQRGNGAVDLAIWDAIGQRSGLSVSRLLGGATRTTLETYNTCAGADYVRTSTQQNSANWGIEHSASQWEDLDAFLTRPEQLARELRAEGITGMKIWPFDRAAERTAGTSISSTEMDAALGIVAAARAGGGPDMRIMIELHGLWLLPTATEILRQLSEFDPFWVEDPIRSDAVDAYAQLRRRTEVPIAAGETAVGRRGFAPLLRAGVLDYATVDVQWTGGLVEARQVASLADAHGVPIAPHDCTGPATLAAAIHLTASSPNGVVQETVRAFLRTWYRDLVTGLPEVVDGMVTVPDDPGHGVKLRPEVLAASIDDADTTVLRRVSRP